MHVYTNYAYTVHPYAHVLYATTSLSRQILLVLLQHSAEGGRTGVTDMVHPKNR